MVLSFSIICYCSIIPLKDLRLNTVIDEYVNKYLLSICANDYYLPIFPIKQSFYISEIEIGF